MIPSEDCPGFERGALTRFPLFSFTPGRGGASSPREAAEKASARNAENDMLRAGMSARDRDDAARALALAVMDFNNAAPVDVSPVLGESTLLEQVRREALSTVVVRGDELGVREGASLKEYQQAAREIYRVLQNKSVVHEELGEIRFTGAGFGEMKKTGFDLRKWQLVPQLHNIVKSARYIRKSELTKKRKDRIKAFHWLEASVELDGKHLRVGVNIAEDIDGNKFYNLNEDVDAWEVKYKKASDDRSGLIPPGGSEALQKEAVASPVDSSVAKDAGGVNMRVETLDLPEPDLSPAREPAAVKGGTPRRPRGRPRRGSWRNRTRPCDTKKSPARCLGRGFTA